MNKLTTTAANRGSFEKLHGYSIKLAIVTKAKLITLAEWLVLLGGA